MNCQEANKVCDKNQYNEAGFWEKIKLSFHLMYCRVCRKYTSRNKKLTKVLYDSKVKTMDTKEKEKLKEALKREMIK